MQITQIDMESRKPALLHFLMNLIIALSAQVKSAEVACNQRNITSYDQPSEKL